MSVAPVTLNRRRLALASVVVLAIILALFLLRRPLGIVEPAWEITIHSDPMEQTPWGDFELEARRHAPGSDVPQSTADLHFRWQVDDVELPGDRVAQTWRSGALGSHHVTVTARGASGVEKTAAIFVQVREVPDKNPFPRAAAPAAAVTDVPFNFADVIVEPSEVCFGEQTTIRAKLKYPDGRAENLVTTINGLAGNVGTFVVMGGEPGMRRLSLMVRDPKLPDKYTETEAYVEVKDCYPPATMVIDKAPDAAVDRFEFTTKLIQLSRTQATPLPNARSYSWDFGDGHQEVSTTPVYGHTFPPEGDRPAERSTTYLVKVEAFDEQKQSLAKGYATVVLENGRRQSRDSGQLMLVAHYQDLPSRKGDDQSMPIALENIDSAETAHLTEATVRNIYCDGSPDETSSVRVDSIFPNSVIGTKQTLSGTLTVSGASGHNLCRVGVIVTGQSTPSSLKVTGAFSMTVGSGAGFRQSITDPQKLAAVQTAMRELGKASLTDEDIRKLEDEGKIPKGVLMNDPFAAPSYSASAPPPPGRSSKAGGPPPR